MGHIVAGEMFASEHVLAEFFNSSTVGLAIFDNQLRYQVVNPSLAAMNRTSVQSHLGKSLRQVLGKVGLQAEPVFKQVLATGRPFFNVELEGELPNRSEPTRWLDNLFPIKDTRGRVSQIGVVVVEVPPVREREVSNTELLPYNEGAVLRSWKEIAQYVRVCVKTVQRWEQDYGFPIRRLKAAKGAMVFTMRADVDNWLRSTTQHDQIRYHDQRQMTDC
ncbi:MAG TPA: PAS domain-containing protein [Terriglobales bacterium]|nr:PAS domain-containing protein [Terriglobales bacterium]